MDAELKKQKKREYYRAWRRRNADKCKAWDKEYKKKDPDRYNRIQRKYRGTVQGVAKGLLAGAKTRALDKGLEFNLTKEWLMEKLSTGHCECTKIAFDYSLNKEDRKGKRRPYSPSIDRIDNQKGYTIDNCRVVLSAFNVALNEWGEELFTQIAQAYFKNLNSEG